MPCSRRDSRIERSPGQARVNADRGQTPTRTLENFYRDIAQYGWEQRARFHPKLTPLENAQQYFARYDKAKRALTGVPELIEEAENEKLLKQSGAHHVIVSSATAGRLLGVSTSAPPLIDVVEDLLTPGQGMALAMRSAERSEVGLPPRKLETLVIALVRRGKVVSLSEPAALQIETGDMLVYVRDDRASNGSSSRAGTTPRTD